MRKKSASIPRASKFFLHGKFPETEDRRRERKGIIKKGSTIFRGKRKCERTGEKKQGVGVNPAEFWGPKRSRRGGGNAAPDLKGRGEQTQD